MDDRNRIMHLGGPTKLAEILGFDKEKGGVQRVQNWLTRGIPAQIKLDWPHLFQIDLGRPSHDRRTPTDRRANSDRRKKEAA